MHKMSLTYSTLLNPFNNKGNSNTQPSPALEATFPSKLMVHQSENCWKLKNKIVSCDVVIDIIACIQISSPGERPKG